MTDGIRPPRRTLLPVADGSPRGSDPVGPDAGDAGACPVLTLVGRGWCSLCDVMRETVAPLAVRHGFRLVEVDCDADPVSDARYGERIPVLVLGTPPDGEELAAGRADAAALDAALAAVAGGGVFR